MAYTWLGMEKLTWEDVQELHKKGELFNGQYYKLYDDETESQIDEHCTWADILEHEQKGGEFGSEIPTVELMLPDGKRITAPEVVDLSKLNGLDDELGYSLWNTIEEYLTLFGIRTEDDQPDWGTVKSMQNKLIEVLAKAGVTFNF